MNQVLIDFRRKLFAQIKTTQPEGVLSPYGIGMYIYARMKLV